MIARRRSTCGEVRGGELAEGVDVHLRGFRVIEAGIVGGALLWITQDGAGDLYFLPTTDIVQLIVLQAIRELGADLVGRL